jgi:circadian clock protein KaiB
VKKEKISKTKVKTGKKGFLRAAKTTAIFERALVKSRSGKYLLRLYVAGITPRSTAALINIRKICEEHLHGRYQLEVIDVYQQPTLAKNEQILAAPTLVKFLPAPLRRFVGDISSTERILVGLDLRQVSPRRSKTHTEKANN